MKMRSVGRKAGSSELKPMLKDEMMYPSLMVDSDQCPECKSMKVGQKSTMTISVKPRRISIDKDGKTTVDMDVMEMGMEEKSEKGKVDKLIDKMYPSKADKE